MTINGTHAKIVMEVNMKKVTKSLVMTEEQARRIEELARETGLSESAVLRNIIERWDGKIVISAEKKKGK